MKDKNHYPSTKAITQEDWSCKEKEREMMHKKSILAILKKNKASFSIIIIWVVIFLINIQTDLMSLLCGKGIHIISGQYYRYISETFLHTNAIHLLCNASTLYWIGYYLEPKIGTLRFIAIGILGSTLSQILFAFIYSGHSSSYGGSALNFALIGAIVFPILFKKEINKFEIKTRYGQWIFIYFVIGCLPFSFSPPYFSLTNLSPIVIHLISFLCGGVISLFFKEINTSVHFKEQGE